MISFVWVFSLILIKAYTETPDIWSEIAKIESGPRLSLDATEIPPPVSPPSKPLPLPPPPPPLPVFPPTTFWDIGDIPMLLDRFLSIEIDHIPLHIVHRIIIFCKRFPAHPGCRKRTWKLPSSLISSETQPMREPQNINPTQIDAFPAVPSVPQPNILLGVPESLVAESPSMPFKELDENDKKALLKTCVEIIQCLDQDEASSEKRAKIGKHELSVAQQIYPPGTDLQKRVELRLLRTQQVKTLLLQLIGIADQVVPDDDGTFQNDVLLTIDQSNYLINALNRPKSRQKRQSLFLDSMPNEKWNVSRPIQYFFDPSFEDEDKKVVRTALNTIASKTCIKFELADQKPDNSYLLYIKADDLDLCGLSYIGKNDIVNPIYLSFNCDDQVGIATHETLHSLGLNHEQLRSDRDDYISVKWDNVNPKLYDSFAIADMEQFTSYGVVYDYYSIMHYKPNSGAVNPEKPTLVPKYQSERFIKIIGQRKELSDKDVELLTAMYCDTGCADKNVYCGLWALKRLCTITVHQLWMSDNCKKSCGLC